MRVESTDASVKPGDKVDVAGFIDTSRVPAALKGAEVRITGHATTPHAEAVAKFRGL